MESQGSSRRALVIDDDPGVTAGLTAMLQASGWETCSAEDARAGYQKIFSESPDLVLLDVNLPDSSGTEMLEQIRATYESLPVVMISGEGDIETVVRLMRMGAQTFLQKPFDQRRLELTLEQASKAIETRRELEALRRSGQRAHGDLEQSGFVGISEAARRLRTLVDRVADAPSPVLIQGESGSGKGLVARLIHERSSRRGAPMVDLNCAGLSKELLESELFGHEKGAFTGATQTKEGLFEIASNGTVFLDEIGELEPAIQARLLKAIEEKRFRRVGGVRDLSSDFRLVAATNRSLEEEVSEGRFRRDLFYRLNVVSVLIPPLRDRMEDLPLITAHLLDALSYELGIRDVSLSEQAEKAMMDYSWPGNVRQVRNTLERALLMSHDGIIRVEDLALDGAPRPSAEERGSSVTSEWDIRPLDDVIRDYIEGAVEAVDGNRRKAARLLKISPSTLYSRLKE